MRIERLRLTPIALGDPPLLNAAGVHAPYALRIVIELDTDAGVTGLSEIPGDADVLQGLERAADRLRGASVHDLHQIWQRLRETFGDDAAQRGDLSWDQRRIIHAQSALEVACLDAIGKRWDCRVCDLLGGAAREHVPFAGYLFFKYEGSGGPAGSRQPEDQGWLAARHREALDPGQLAQQAGAMAQAFGFRSFKVKAGILDPDVEVAGTIAVREAMGADVPVRIDPNGVWSFETALRQGRRLQGAIEYYEDPVRGQAAMARLRKALDIPLATNMCTTSLDDLPSSFALGSEDILLLDHHFWGGLRACVEIARLSAPFGRRVSAHSNSHAGISLAAMTHLGAVLPSLPFALDTHYPWQQDEIIAGGKLPIVDGAVAVPEGPGLGVTVDQSALARAHAQYVACGLTRRDDEREMQKRVPGWTFQPTRY